MSNLYDASHQWANRPDDERFSSIQEMYDATRRYADSAVTSNATIGSLRLEADNGNLHLVGQSGKHAKVTHYSFGQVSRFAKAPADYLRKLPATLAAQNVNYGLKAADSTDKLSLLLHQNGDLVARAVTSDSYDRVWNYEVVNKVMTRLTPEGWVVPPARPVRAGQKGTRKATADDILPNQADFGLAVKVGDDIAPAGLYASDHDMFAFLVKMGDSIEDAGKLLNRGVFIQNSEVGDCSLKFKFFVMDQVCGNHICWGVSNVNEVKVRHVKRETVSRGNTLGNAMMQWRVMASRMPSAGQLEADIQKARSFEIAGSKEEVLDAVFGFAKKKGLNRLSMKVLGGAYDLAEKSPRYGAPTAVWGLVNGLTELSQSTSYADDRTDLDQQAGRVMEIAF
jgi:Domain of unknown function (DUF932)